MRSFLIKLASCAIVFFLACFYARSISYRDPGSVFFDRQRAYEQRYSQHRKAEVKQFIQSLETEGLPRKAGSSPSLCVGLSSVRREHTQYLEIKLGSLLHGLSPEERADMYVSALIAESDPDEHPSWHEEWIHRSVDDIYTYNTTVKEKDRLQQLKTTGAYAEKGIHDYVYALERCYTTGAPYIGMFEDDIMLADGWLVRTLLSLKKAPAIDNEESPWLFMRLFNQERSTGWASNRIGDNNEAWTIVGIALGLSAAAFLARRQWQGVRAYLDLETIGVLVMVMNPALVILFFQSGKASMLPPSPGVYEESFGCCSQAMIFPRTRVPLLVEYLREKNEGQVDLLLDDLAKETGLARYASYPMQAQHIGLESSRMTEKDEAQAIWSMAFEDLDPVSLAKAHKKMISELYSAKA